MGFIRLKMEKKEILRHMDKYWDIVNQSLHENAPKNKELQITWGEIEKRMHILNNNHREHLKELFSQLD